MTRDTVPAPDPVEKMWCTSDPAKAAEALEQVAASIRAGEFERVCLDRVSEAIDAGSRDGFRFSQRQDKCFLLLRAKVPKRPQGLECQASANSPR